MHSRWVAVEVFAILILQYSLVAAARVYVVMFQSFLIGISETGNIYQSAIGETTSISSPHGYVIGNGIHGHRYFLNFLPMCSLGFFDTIIPKFACGTTIAVRSTIQSTLHIKLLGRNDVCKMSSNRCCIGRCIKSSLESSGEQGKLCNQVTEMTPQFGTIRVSAGAVVHPSDSLRPSLDFSTMQKYVGYFYLGARWTCRVGSSRSNDIEKPFVIWRSARVWTI